MMATEAEISAKINGVLCDLGLANVEAWREETLRLRAALADRAERERDELERESDEWRQAAKVEAGLRREFLERAERAEADLAAAREMIKFAAADNWRHDHMLTVRNRARAFLERTATNPEHK